MILIKRALILSVCLSAMTVMFTDTAFGQTRERVVRPTSSQPTNLPPTAQPVDRTRSLSTSRPTLTNEIVVRRDAAYEPPLVAKTA